MIDDFLIRALVAGFGIALIAGPLGCFVVWRRMAYFGDTMAHSGLLGVAIGLFFSINLILGVFIACVAVALVLVSLQRARGLATDTLMGILAHSALSLGLVVISFMPTVRVDLMGYLFGDILAVSMTDILLIYAVSLTSLLCLVLVWNRLLALTIHSQLAAAEGIATKSLHIVFMLLIAGLIAAAMKIVGILLITSLLIIPAAAARPFARSPEAMAVMAILAGFVAVTLGLIASLQWDTPSGPSIVLASAGLFGLGTIFSAVRAARSV
jgi:zinc transport system permease protein